MAQKTIRIHPEEISDFLKAVRHNKIVLAAQVAAHRFCNADYYFVRVVDGFLELIPPGSHDMDAVRASNDYIAGSLVGALPFLDLHGSDGVKIDECGNVREVELKVCMKSGLRYEINTKGYITIVDGVGGFRSDAAAHYEIVHNIQGKNVDTYIVLFDKSEWELIDVYKLTGDQVLELIGKIQKSGEDKTSKKRSITLSAFIKHGQKVFQNVLSAVTVGEWENRIYARCGRCPSEVVPFWNSSRILELQTLYEGGIPVNDIRIRLGASTNEAVKSMVKKQKFHRRNVIEMASQLL